MTVIMIILSIAALVACKQEPAHEHTWNEGTDNGNGKIVYECTECHESRSEYKTYATGASGPAGGKVFYDCDADNESGNADGLKSSECGWRYLEAAPADLGTFIFGYYRTSDSGSNLFVNGTTTYNASNCTGTAIGTGKANTEKLVNAMGSQAYLSSSGSDKAAYAAKACADYVIGDFDDWFLPSKDELNAVFTNLWVASHEGFASGYFWSSSEDSGNAGQAWEQYFDDSNPYLGPGKKNLQTRFQSYYVRPIRAF